MLNEGIDKSQRGWWPNSVLQLAWEGERGAGQPLNWTDAAQNLLLWKETLQLWLHSHETCPVKVRSVIRKKLTCWEDKSCR